MTLTPGPPTLGPETRKKFWATGLLMTEWAMRPSPMNPAVGSGATAGSHTSHGPTLVLARTAAKLHGGGTAPGVGTQPWSEVKLIHPGASATRDGGPEGPGHE